MCKYKCGTVVSGRATVATRGDGHATERGSSGPIGSRHRRGAQAVGPLLVHPLTRLHFSYNRSLENGISDNYSLQFVNLKIVAFVSQLGESSEDVSVMVSKVVAAVRQKASKEEVLRLVSER